MRTVEDRVGVVTDNLGRQRERAIDEEIENDSKRPFMEGDERERRVWGILYDRQRALIEDRTAKGQISETFLAGLDALGMTQKFPNLYEISAYLKDRYGWQLVSTPVRYSNKTQWFDWLSRKMWPISEYIREEKDLDFTPLPDYFHDVFGHMPFLADPKYMATINRFARAYERSIEVSQENPAIFQQLYAAEGNLWWFTTGEFGKVVGNNGQVQVASPGLMSSYGELRYALDDPRVEDYEFDPQVIFHTAPTAGGYHPGYFVLRSPQQLDDTLDQWVIDPIAMVQPSQ